MISLTLPIYYTILFKTKAPKTCMLGMNVYRNWHFITQNNAKIWYAGLIKPLLPLDTKVIDQFEVYYELYYKSPVSDGSNVIALVEKFTLDALKSYNIIIDDSVKYHKGSSWKVIEQDKENPRVVITLKPFIKG